MAFAATMVNSILQSNINITMLAMTQRANTTDADPAPDVRAYL